jgi:hypothetical protein
MFDEAARWGLRAAALGHAEAEQMFVVAPIMPLPTE